MAKRRRIPQEVRDQLLVEAMHRCCLCPEHNDVTDLHHVVPISEGGPDSEENLMVVCPTCHAKIHRLRKRYTPEQLRMYKERWVRLCGRGLPLDVRLSQAFVDTPPPERPVADAARSVVVQGDMVNSLVITGDRNAVGGGTPITPSRSGGTRAGGPRGSKGSIPPNPFVPLSGRISDPERVFDREREIGRAIEVLRAGSSVAFVGPAGVGKSSLLTKLMALAPERLGLPWEGAWLDLQNVQDEKDFYSALCHRLGIANCRGYALARALQGRRVFLCLDEVEAITGKGFSRGVRAQLRGLAEGGDAPLKLALAARTSLDRLFPDSEGLTSPLAGVCLQVDVGPWDEEAARALLAERLAGTEVAFPGDQAARLVEASQGHPGRLMQGAYDLYARLAGGAG